MSALRFDRLEGAVAVLSNTDAPLNRMSLDYVAELNDAIDEIAADESIRAFVITADGLTDAAEKIVAAVKA